MSLGAGLLAPVLVLYFRNATLGLHEIGLVMSTFELSMFLFEVPTGVIADKKGRKFSMSCCFVCFVVAGAIFLHSTDVKGFLLGSVLQGFGYTCISGALQAWVVDRLKEFGYENSISATLISGQQGKKGGFVVGSILGG